MVGRELDTFGNVNFVDSASSEVERSGAERSAESTKFQKSLVRVSTPDTEVASKNRRRQFAASYKAKIVREADACKEPGEVGALLRREGLYSAQLVAWRKLYRKSGESGFADTKRGRKPTKNPLQPELDRLQEQLDRTQKKLAQAELIIDFQKNLCEILGISPARVSNKGEN